jgi:hypothetical protein
MKLKPLFGVVILLGCAHAQMVRLGQSTQLNGISPVYGMFGQVQTTYQGTVGQYAFWKPEGKPIHLLPYPSASISGIEGRCFSGTYSNPETFGISGFQQCTDRNGNVQFFSFDFGANATLIAGQVSGTDAVAGYYDDFHFKDTGFISTPVFDGDGKVLYYNTSYFTVPGAISTNLLAINRYGIAGQFENSNGNWSGFLQRTGSALEIFNFPGALNTGVTAISEGCYAGYYDVGDGVRHGFFRCSNDPIPLDIGYGTWITEITESNSLVGYAQGSQGGYFGFVWEGLTGKHR